MRPEVGNRRDRLRAMLADLKMPGALEAVDDVLAQADSGAATAGEAIEQLLDAQIGLRNNRRLQPLMPDWNQPESVRSASTPSSKVRHFRLPK